MERAEGGGMRMRMSWGGLVGAVMIVQMSSCGTSCFLDDSGIVGDQYRYDARATIQSSDRIRSVVDTADLTALSGGADETIFTSDPTYTGAASSVAERFSTYLRQRTEARVADADFIAVYGVGPFCVVGAITATATSEFIDYADPRIHRGLLDALPPCPCAETCGNPPGVAGELTVAPTSAGDPLRVDFGTAAVGGAAVTRDVTLTNSGDGRLCLDVPRILGTSPNPGHFSVMVLGGCDATPEGIVELEPGDTCAFRAAFSPTDDGPLEAHVPAGHGCGGVVTLAGVGATGFLVANPAPACFAPPGACREVGVRIQNASASGVNLTAMSAAPAGWEAVRLEDASGTPQDLTFDPFLLGPGDEATAVVRTCTDDIADGTLRITHDGTDYGAAGSPTGDVDNGSPLAVRLRSPSSGCTP